MYLAALRIGENDARLRHIFNGELHFAVMTCHSSNRSRQVITFQWFHYKHSKVMIIKNQFATVMDIITGNF
jgi:hypothetical protein